MRLSTNHSTRRGHLTLRKVPITESLYEGLSRRFARRDRSKPWVFWHTYLNPKTGGQVVGPYQARPRAIQKILGHENRKTTEIYLHSFGEAERAAMAVYEGARKKSHTSLTQIHTQ